MFPFVDVGNAILHNIKLLLLNPIIYIVLLLVYWQYHRIALNERKMHSVRIHSAVEQTLVSVGYGILGGLFASALLLVLGVILNPYDMIYVWAVALLLALINIRYLCFSYATGILGVISWLTVIWPAGGNLPVFEHLWEGIAKLNVPVIIALVAVLHLTEALLIWLHAAKKASPAFISDKRGKIVGGFSMQKIWFLPLFVIVAIDPVATGGVIDSMARSSGTITFPEWWPLLPISSIVGLLLMMLPIPAVLGYGEIAISRTPSQKSRQTALYLAVYSVLLLALALISSYSPWLLLLASLFSAIAHEAIITFGKRKEMLDVPLFGNPPRGIRILHIIKDTTADKLGLQAGEVIIKVNGMEINNRSDLHIALSLQPVYVKMEVENLDRQIKFVHTPLYQGEHHSLGMIVLPNERPKYYQVITDHPLKMWWKKFRKS